MGSFWLAFALGYTAGSVGTALCLAFFMGVAKGNER